MDVFLSHVTLILCESCSLLIYLLPSHFQLLTPGVNHLGCHLRIGTPDTLVAFQMGFEIQNLADFSEDRVTVTFAKQSSPLIHSKFLEPAVLLDGKTYSLTYHPIGVSVRNLSFSCYSIG